MLVWGFVCDARYYVRPFRIIVGPNHGDCGTVESQTELPDGRWLICAEIYTNHLGNIKDLGWCCYGYVDNLLYLRYGEPTVRELHQLDVA